MGSKNPNYSSISRLIKKTKTIIMQKFEDHLKERFPGSGEVGLKGTGMCTAEAMIGRFIGTESNEYTEDFDLSIDESEPTMINIAKDFYVAHGFTHRTDIPSQTTFANPLILAKNDDIAISVNITKFPDRMRFTVSVI